MGSDYLALLGNIEKFARKYYVNELIKGLIYSVFLLCLLFLLFNSIEYFAYFESGVRFFMFYAYISIFSFVLVKFILIPVAHLIRFRKTMPHETAARIIGKHFPEVDDKLLNTLQLQRMGEGNAGSIALLEAGISQKIRQLSPLPFSNAVSFSKNLRKLRFAVIPVLLLMALIVISPSFVMEPSFRIISYNQHFNKPLPYQIDIENEFLTVVQQSDFRLWVSVTGEELPASLSIRANGYTYNMDKTSHFRFYYDFKNVQENIDFRIIAGDVETQQYTLTTLPRPVLSSIEAEVVFPEYMNRKNEFYRDQSFISLPVGSRVLWTLHLRNADRVILSSADTQTAFLVENGKAVTETLLMESNQFKFRPVNSMVNLEQDLVVDLEAVADLYPEMAVSIVAESNSGKERFFSGLIQDDYGFSRLNFVYRIENPELNEVSDLFLHPIQIERNRQRQDFYYMLTVDSLNLQAGDRLTYFFEVWDNDAIFGPKSRRSSVFEINILSQQKIDSLIRIQESEKENQVGKLLNETREIKKEMDDFLREMMQKKELDWNDRNQLKNLIERQKNVEEQLKEMMQTNKELQQLNEERRDKNKELLEKQKKLDSMLEEIMNDELRQLLEELQKLMEEANKEQVREMLNQMKMNNEQFERTLDRNLSLLKQLQFEMEMQRLISQLNEMADELNKEAGKESATHAEKKESIEKMEEIKDQFDKFSGELDSLRKKNQELDKPFELQETKEQELDIKNDLNKALEQHNKQQQSAAGKKKTEASSKMSKLSLDLQNMMKKENVKRKAEDARTLRILLQNVLRASLNQESLMHKLEALRRDDPAYIEIIRDQSNLRESFGIIEDSLTALAKRQPEIETFVFSEIEQINRRMNNALENMQDRRTANTLSEMQFSMMSLNNLGLMLSEALNKMEQSMGMPNPMQGEQDSQEGQSGSESLSNMKDLQRALGEQLKEGIERMKGKQGSKEGESSQSEDLARMAAQQEALRNQMQQLMDDFKSQGVNGDALSEILQDMAKLEEDLVNKRLTDNLLKRNEDITIRLLKAENAQRERELKEERESKRPKEFMKSNPTGIIEYNEIIKRQEDALKLSPIVVKPYYRQKINEYMLQSKTEAGYE
jgi:hypothetical protein